MSTKTNLFSGRASENFDIHAEQHLGIYLWQQRINFLITIYKGKKYATRFTA